MDHPSILFLDIDGVVNRIPVPGSGVSFLPIHPECAAQLARIFAAVPCGVVLSSAWRYMVLDGALTLGGFEYMLHTHRVECHGRLVATTAKDEDVPGRGNQIRRYLAGLSSSPPHVVLDDNDDGITEAGLTFVRTDPRLGLTPDLADRVISLLERSP